MQGIRRHLDLDSAKLLATALVSSHHYCNSLSSGITDTDLGKLQSRLARVVTKTPPPLTRAVPLLHSLHGLPVKFGANFKIYLLTYKTLSEKQPFYLHSLLATPLPSRSLRSNKGNTLSVPKDKTNGGKWSFSSCVPSLWNSLPLSVRSSTKWYIPRDIILTWPFPHRHRDARWPVDVLELLHRFCCWALIWMSRHWAWLCGDIGTIENCLLDWSWLLQFTCVWYRQHWPHKASLRVQNRLAHLVTKSPLFTCSLPLLRSLHWLPVRFRILFKIGLLTYKTLREKQPVYLHSMLAALLPSRSLRSNNDNSLSVPAVKTNTGERALHSCAPSL